MGVESRLVCFLCFMAASMTTSAPSPVAHEEAIDVRVAEDAIALGTLVKNAAPGSPIGKRFGRGMKTRGTRATYTDFGGDRESGKVLQQERLALMTKLVGMARSGGGVPGEDGEYCAVLKPHLFQLGFKASVLRDGLLFLQPGDGGIERPFEFDFSEERPWTASIRLGCNRPGCVSRDCPRCVYFYQVFIPTCTAKEHEGCDCGRPSVGKAASRWSTRKSTYAPLVRQLPDEWILRQPCGVIVSLQVMRLGSHTTPPTTMTPYSNVLTSPAVADAFRGGTQWTSLESPGHKAIEAAKAVCEMREECIESLRKECQNLLKFMGPGGWTRLGSELGGEGDLDMDLDVTIACVLGGITAVRQSERDGRFWVEARHRVDSLIALEDPIHSMANTEEGMAEAKRWVEEHGGDFVFRPTTYRVLREVDVKPGKGNPRKFAENSAQQEAYEWVADVVARVRGVSGDDAKQLGWGDGQRRDQGEGPVDSLYRSVREKLKQCFDGADDILSVEAALREEMEIMGVAPEPATRAQAAAMKEAKAAATVKNKEKGRKVVVRPGHAFAMLDDHKELVNEVGLGDVIFVDGTHCTNTHGWELWNVLALNEAGVGVPVMHAWLQQSSAMDILEALEFYLARAGRKPEVVVMDMDMAQLLATAVALPDCRVRFCGFHFVQAVVRKFRKKDHPMVDVLRGLQHAPTVDVFQVRLGMALDALMSSEEREAWAAEPRTKSGRSARLSRLAQLDAMVKNAELDADADGVGCVAGVAGDSAESAAEEAAFAGGFIPSTMMEDALEELELDLQEVEDAAVVFSDPVASTTRLEEALAGVRDSSLSKRRDMFQYVINILATRRHWSKAWWAFLLHITTSNWIESYHRILKGDKGVGSASVKLPASVVRVLRADLQIIAKRRLDCVKDLEFLSNLILAHPSISAGTKEVVIQLGEEKGSFLGRHGTGVRAIRGTRAMDQEFSDVVLCHPLVLAALVNNASKDHVVAVINSIKRHAAASSAAPHAPSVERVTTGGFGTGFDEFRVASAGGTGFYTVVLGAGAPPRLCPCPSFAQRGFLCKHVVAVFEVALAEKQIPLGGSSDAIRVADTLLPAVYWTGKSISVDYAMRSELEIAEKERSFFLSLTGKTLGKTASKRAPNVLPMDVSKDVSRKTTTSTTLPPPPPPPPASPFSPWSPGSSSVASSPSPPGLTSGLTASVNFLPITPRQNASPVEQKEAEEDCDEILGLFEQLRKRKMKLIATLRRHGVFDQSREEREQLKRVLAAAVGGVDKALELYQGMDIAPTDCRGVPVQRPLDKPGDKRKRGSVHIRKTRSARHKSKPSKKRSKPLPPGNSKSGALAYAREKGTGVAAKVGRSRTRATPMSYISRK